MTEISVEVAFAAPEQQLILEVVAQKGITVAEAVEQSDIQTQFPDHDLSLLPKGVWGQKKPDDFPLSDGDRVEIYRPLVTDAKEARRQRAQKKGG